MSYDTIVTIVLMIDILKRTIYNDNQYQIDDIKRQTNRK